MAECTSWRPRTQIAGLLALETRDQALLIENVAVDSAFQGQGLGRRLMAFAEQHARERELRELRLYTNEVMVENLSGTGAWASWRSKHAWMTATIAYSCASRLHSNALAGRLAYTAACVA